MCGYDDDDDDDDDDVDDVDDDVDDVDVDNDDDDDDDFDDVDVGGREVGGGGKLEIGRGGLGISKNWGKRANVSHRR